MSENWDGKDRRGSSQEDHDVLTRIDVNLSNFMKRFEEHADKDDDSFKKIDKSFEKVDERTKVLEDFKIKFVAVVAVVIFTIELILKIWR